MEFLYISKEKRQIDLHSIFAWNKEKFYITILWIQPWKVDIEFIILKTY